MTAYREKVTAALRQDDFEALTTLAIEMALLCDKKATTARTNGLEIYTPQFEEAWELYPKRHGGNSKREAWQAWQARLRSKSFAAPIDMIAGTKRYAKFCLETGKIGTEKVMQARRFWGPMELFRETWGTETPDNAGVPVRHRNSAEDLKWKAQRAQWAVDRRKEKVDGDQWWDQVVEQAKAKQLTTHAQLLFYAAEQANS